MKLQNKALDVGLGLRPSHYQDILDNKPNVSWFEIITENYLDSFGLARDHLFEIAQHYPVAMHGVSLSMGSTDELNLKYLHKVKHLAQKINPWLISDHLCFTHHQQIHSHDLLPLPYTQNCIEHVVDRIKFVQDFFGRNIAIENVSSYISYKDSVMPEWAFISEISERAQCKILLDVNNVFVSAFNHNFNPKTYLDFLNPSHVAQYHLAGFTDMGDYLFDTHSKPVHQDVWALYEYTLKKIGVRPTLIEWDEDLPDFNTLWAQGQCAKNYIEKIST